MNLDNLFKWHRELEIKDTKGDPYIPEGEKEPLTLYQRVIGDADLSEARKAALRASRQLRKELKDADSSEYASLMPEFEQMDNAALRSAIIITRAPQIREQAEETANKPKYPAEPPSDASLEERENYQHELDTYDERVAVAVEEKTNELIEQRNNELKKHGRDKLVKIFTNSVIDSICRRRMLDTFNSRCAYYGTYIDKAMTRHAFSSYEAFENATPELKSQIISAYIRLELDGGEVKKSD